MSSNCYLFKQMYDIHGYGNINPIIPNSKELNTENKCNVIVDLNNDVVEIPLYLLYNISFKLNRVLQSNKIIAPLNIMNTVSVKTTNKLFMEIFKEYAGVTKIITSKGEVFYGNRGILFDKDFNVIFLSTFTINKDIMKSKESFFIDGVNFYINPLVFKNKSFVSSTLVKDIIPYISTTSLMFITTPPNISSTTTIKPKVLVTNDFSKYIIKPETPKVYTNMNKEINNMLSNCIEELVIHNA